ncbi:MAG: hypothetical protein HQ588_05240 [Deltaproteobacteria bacterium]|nr:hypothetical protein [Deltaproteobacteria bacterium]
MQALVQEREQAPELERAQALELELEPHKQQLNYQPMQPPSPQLLSFFYSFSSPPKVLEPNCVKILSIESYHPPPFSSFDTHPKFRSIKLIRN